MNQIDLSGLRDIKLPIKPSFWPLAEGWYLILALIFVTIILSYLLWRSHRNKPLPYALRELNKIKQENSTQSLKELSKLLKRVAMAKYGRDPIAPLSEDTWQEFILSAAPDVFNKNQAKLLAFAIYNPNPKKCDKKLFSCSQKWIKNVLKK